MPRKKRRKSYDADRPPLLFEESPVNIKHWVPSPAQGSDFPPTAEVVQVNGDTSWVSPQFPRDGGSSHRKRTRRKCTRQANTRQRKKAQNINNTALTSTASSLSTVKPKSKKYAKLKFAGDDTTEVSLFKVDGSDKVTGDDCTRTSECMRDKENEVENDCTPVMGTICSGCSRGNSFYAPCKCGRRKAAELNSRNDQSPADGTHLDGEIQCTKMPKRLFEQQRSTDGADINGTRTRRQSTHLRSKKLFSTVSNVSKHDRSDRTQKKKQMSTPNSPGTPLQEVYNSTMLDTSCYGSDYDSPCGQRRSCRLKYKFLFSDLNYTQLGPRRGEWGQLLALDTPESDYGLSVRMRRIKEGIS